MPTGYIPILQIKTKDGKWLPVNAIGGQVASKVLYNNAYPTVEQALDYLFENGTGGGGGGTGGASTAANVSYTNTQLPNVKNVKAALDELVPDSHSHENKGTLDKLSDLNGKLQYNGSDISITKNGVIAALGYTPEAVSAQVATGSNITLTDNTEYRLADVTTLSLSYPTGKFECWMRLSFAASGNITVTLPNDTEYLGATPDFKNSDTWELSFKDKVLAAKKIGVDDGGAGGENGVTPHIGENGNWYIGNTDTGKPSRGAKGDKGEDGKSAYQYAQDGGYTGTETEFAEKMAQEQLSGTTSELTPTQVYDAVSAGIPVKVQYLHDVYGLLSFTAFNVVESLNVIVSQTIVYFNSVYFLAVLSGAKSNNSWGVKFTTLAEESNIPVIPTVLPNPNAINITVGDTLYSYDGSNQVDIIIDDGTEVSY